MTIQSSKTLDNQNEGTRAPILDVSIAFPQATPASVFPPCASDYYHFDDLLTPEEQSVRIKVRERMEKHVAPIMTKYWEKAEFPFEVVPKLGALCIACSSIKVFPLLQGAVATAEMARVDASCSTLILEHSSLAMLTIGGIHRSTFSPSLCCHSVIHLNPFYYGVMHSAIWNRFTRTKAPMTSTPWSQAGRSPGSLVSNQWLHVNEAECDNLYPLS